MSLITRYIADENVYEIGYYVGTAFHIVLKQKVI